MIILRFKNYNGQSKVSYSNTLDSLISGHHSWPIDLIFGSIYKYPKQKN